MGGTQPGESSTAKCCSPMEVLPSTGLPPTQRTPHPHPPGYENRDYHSFHPASPTPTPTSSINTTDTRGLPTLCPPPGLPPGRRAPRPTAEDKGFLSFTPRMLSETHDLWTLIFPVPQFHPLFPSGLSGCLSPTRVSAPPAPTPCFLI